ncbi:hypothetical protein ILYODFUR_035832 [Ilyodon furcidens]|uniref:Uncharacterized protein n=1 Tax=Ilyodon furcidens TaxID=33524 RepID=A0ABV0VMJ2_9TELE
MPHVDRTLELNPQLSHCKMPTLPTEPQSLVKCKVLHLGSKHKHSSCVHVLKVTAFRTERPVTEMDASIVITLDYNNGSLHFDIMKSSSSMSKGDPESQMFRTQIGLLNRILSYQCLCLSYQLIGFSVLRNTTHESADGRILYCSSSS